MWHVPCVSNIIHPPICPSVRPPCQSVTHSQTQSCSQSDTNSFIRLLVRSFIHSYTPAFLPSFLVSFNHFKYNNETLPIVDKQTYLGIEMTSSGRYTYAREILSKKATKVLSIIKRSFSNIDSATIAIKNKLF